MDWKKAGNKGNNGVKRCINERRGKKEESDREVKRLISIQNIEMASESSERNFMVYCHKRNFIVFCKLHWMHM